MVSVSGFCCAEIPGASGLSTASVSRDLVSQLEWKPAVDLLSRDELEIVLNSKAEDAENMRSPLAKVSLCTASEGRISEMLC